MLTEQPDPDPDSIILSVIFIVILVLFSGYFSATETAFTSVNRTKLKLKAQDGNKAAKNALYLLDRYDKVISAILVGNNLVNITLSVLFNNLFETIIPNAAVSGIVSVAVSTAIVLTFGEVSPKMIAKENSEKISMAFGYPMRAIMVIPHHDFVCGAEIHSSQDIQVEKRRQNHRGRTLVHGRRSAGRRLS